MKIEVVEVFNPIVGELVYRVRLRGWIFSRHLKTFATLDEAVEFVCAAKHQSRVVHSEDFK